MSSDWNEPGATWQSTPNSNWPQSPDLIPPQHVEDDYPLHAQQETYASASEAQNIHDPSSSPEPDVFPDNQETDEGEESDIVAGLDPEAQPDSLLKQLWQYVPLIVFPLLFFGIACLLILPSVATSHPSLPPVSLWFIGAVLAIIAIAQGVAVYFAGPRHNMWILGTVGGLILFVLFGVFAIVGPILGTVLLLAVLGGCIYLARRCIHPVAEGSVDIVYVSGKYNRTLFPGFNLVWPWEDVTQRVNIEETNWNCPPQKIQLSPEEDVVLRAVISYQVVPEDAHLAVTQIDNWQESLRNLFVTTLQTIATHFTPTDFLAWPQSLQAYQAQTTHPDPQSTHLPDEGVDDFAAGPARRELINTLLFEQMRDRVALWGIQIHWVRIRDIELAPHTLAGISAPPLLSGYTTNDHQVEKELIAAASGAQPNRTSFADRQDNTSIGGSIEHISADQEPTEAMQVAVNSTPGQLLPPQKLPSEESLRKAYEQVQSGKVTDPQTIRQIAITFEAVARDPELSQKISFDAERASDNLYKQARHYEEMYQSGEVYTDVTQPNLYMQ
jgi:regulator of protease activity HflC (stomatin/prohibitin superfamily)